MPKKICYSCQHEISYWDVYAEYSSGCLCSQCILELNASVRTANAPARPRGEMIGTENVMKDLQPVFSTSDNDRIHVFG